MSCEQELKIGLYSEADREKLCRLLGPAAEVLSQVNYYFDTQDGALRRSRALLRLRRQNEDFILTYKRGLALDSGYFQALEIEAAVSKADRVEDLLTGMSSYEGLPPLRQLRADGFTGDLRLLGSARNMRRRYSLPTDEFLEVDSTAFDDGCVDCELEIETLQADRALQLVQELCQKAQIEYFLQTTTKYERFLSHQR